MSTPTKCILELDWKRVWGECGKLIGAVIDYEHPHSLALIELIEQEINRAAERLIEESNKDKFRSVRYKYQYYGTHKIDCIKELRRIDKTLSLKEAVELIDSWKRV